MTKEERQAIEDSLPTVVQTMEIGMETQRHAGKMVHHMDTLVMNLFILWVTKEHHMILL